MEFEPDIAGMHATANLLPSPAVAALVERLIDLLDRRAGDADFEPGDMELADHLQGRMRLHRTTWNPEAAALACLLLAGFDGQPDPACPALFLDGQAPETSPALARGATLLCKTDYATLVSPVTRDPVWVAEHLTTAMLQTG